MHPPPDMERAGALATPAPPHGIELDGESEINDRTLPSGTASTNGHAVTDVCIALRIPNEIPDDVVGAALAYAKAGWFVGPIKLGEDKHPGSILGKDWPGQTSRDPQRIIDWFAAAPEGAGLFLHMGRSGAVGFDLDHPEQWPADLVHLLTDPAVPFQSTRAGKDQDSSVISRGHYVFLVPPGQLIGNSIKDLPGEGGEKWGEIRGTNGVIVVEPTIHEKAADGGRYRWERTGPLPMLPTELAEKCREPVSRSGAPSAFDERAVDLPLSDHPVCRHLAWVRDRLIGELGGGGSRHDTLTGGLVDLVRRGTEHPGLSEVLGAVRGAFLASVTADKSRSMGTAAAEWDRLLDGAWGIVALDPGVRWEQDSCIVLCDPPWHPGDPIPVPRPPRPVGSPTGKPGGEADDLGLVFERLDDLLSEPDDPVVYRIDKVLPVGAHVTVVAQFKAGKTTTVANLIRSLVDGDTFLDEFEVKPFEGSVVLIDDEMDRKMLRRWLRAQNIKHTTRVYVICLRGRVEKFNLLDPVVLDRWAQRLRDLGAAFVIFDCLRPVLDALGLDENREAGRFVQAFKALLSRAGVDESALIHHMGHTGERGRGDSSLRGATDVEWKLIRPMRKDGDREVDDPAGPRFFQAFGRDVDYPECGVEYDKATRRLSLGTGNRKSIRSQEWVAKVLEYVGANLECAKSAPEKKITGDTEAIRGAVDEAIRKGWINEANQGLRGVAHPLTLTPAGHAELGRLAGFAGFAVDLASEVRQNLAAPLVGERGTRSLPREPTSAALGSEVQQSWTFDPDTDNPDDE